MKKFEAISSPKAWEEWKKKPREGEVIDESRYELLAAPQREARWTTDAGQLKICRDAYFKLSNEVAERGLAARKARQSRNPAPQTPKSPNLLGFHY